MVHQPTTEHRNRSPADRRPTPQFPEMIRSVICVRLKMKTRFFISFLIHCYAIVYVYFLLTQKVKAYLILYGPYARLTYPEYTQQREKLPKFGHKQDALLRFQWRRKFHDRWIKTVHMASCLRRI